MDISGFLIFALVLVVIAVLFAFQSVKVVPQQTAWVVERLGKFNTVLTPGLNFIIPFIDRVAYRHSLERNSARYAKPGLYYARQHAVDCRRCALFPGDGSATRLLWDVKLCGRDHAIGADDLAFGRG